VVDLAIDALLLSGSLFMFLAAIGVLRMPDIYMRMSAVTKSATMGAGLLLLGAILAEADLGILVKAVMLALFGFLTSPITAHLVARAAYVQGVPLWEDTLVDELKGHYEATTRELQSPDPEETLVAERFIPEEFESRHSEDETE
jgi:multicomponent Na+:H+ antiporter subunit G